MPTVASAASAAYVSFVSSTGKYSIFGRPPSTYCTSTPGSEVLDVFMSQRSAHAK